MANRTDKIIDVISDAKQEAADIAQSIQHLIGLRDLLRGALVDVEHCAYSRPQATVSHAPFLHRRDGSRLRAAPVQGEADARDLAAQSWAEVTIDRNLRVPAGGSRGQRVARSQEASARGGAPGGPPKHRAHRPAALEAGTYRSLENQDAPQRANFCCLPDLAGLGLGLAGHTRG